MRYLFFYVMIFISLDALAFSWKDCKLYLHRGGGGIGAIPISTTSFVSSFGKCSAIGMVEQQTQFIAVNDDSLKIDMARGQGEYISAYAELSRCDTLGSAMMGTALQNNFEKIWGRNLNANPEEVQQRIQEVIEHDPILNKECGISLNASS